MLTNYRRIKLVRCSKNGSAIPTDTFIIKTVCSTVISEAIGSSISIRKTNYKEKKSEE